MNTIWSRLRNIDAERPRVLDTLLGGLLLLGAVLSAAVPGPHDRPADATLYALLAVGVLPYVWRRRAPMLVLVIASLPVLALTSFGYSTAVIGPGLFLAAYTVAAWSRTRVAGCAAGYVVLLIAAVVALTPRTIELGEVATDGALFIGAFALGRSANDRRQNLDLLRERAELAARARIDDARNAVADERLRIAQELHDVLAHSLGVIALQSGVGAHIIDVDPAGAKASLVAVVQTSRSALTEVRRILGALRDQDDPIGYHPPLGLEAVGDLAAELTAAGLPVAVHIEGDRDHIPAALDLTAYRLVQESLTNVVRHAGPARAEVTVRYGPGAVHLEVVDDGRLTPALAAGAKPGHGQLGMRERVAVFGGSLAAGSRTGGGYRVAACLPYADQGA
ncbi:MAG TPA: sensor histidine kinase [Dermatophilaceae bacterium]